MASKTSEKYEKQVCRTNRKLMWVKLGLTRVSPLAQRVMRPSFVKDIVAGMDLDMIGTPEVSFRDSFYWVMDGQHRIDALKVYLGQGWEDQHIQCWVAFGLTEKEEAHIFLVLNHKVNLDVFQHFQKGVFAGYEKENAINDIVVREKLIVTKERVPGRVVCTQTLIKVYERDGADALRKSLAMLRDAFGDVGMAAALIDGLGLVCNRYNGIMQEKETIQSLSHIHGGAAGILNMAEKLRQRLGSSKSQCVASVVVDTINRGRQGKAKLCSWWKEA